MEKILRIIQNEITSHSKLYFMYVCTCNKCGGIFEDTNPGEHSKEYEEDVTISPLVLAEDEEGFGHMCPTCGTDAYLVDNVYVGAGPC